MNDRPLVSGPEAGPDRCDLTPRRGTSGALITLRPKQVISHASHVFVRAWWITGLRQSIGSRGVRAFARQMPDAWLRLPVHELSSRAVTLGNRSRAPRRPHTHTPITLDPSRTRVSIRPRISAVSCIPARSAASMWPVLGRGIKLPSRRSPDQPARVDSRAAFDAAFYAPARTS